MLLIAFIFGLQASAGPAVSNCESANAGISIDHVVVAVNDLEAAVVSYRELGFSTKRGRAHANGLTNQHIEFADGTELELIAIGGDPGDSTARAYAEFLKGGEGAAYVAISGQPAAVISAAETAGLQPVMSKAGPFTYVTFASEPRSNIFFVAYDSPGANPTDDTDHPNGALSLRRVWLDTGPKMKAFLELAGARDCGTATTSDGRIGTRLGLVNGELLVTEAVSSRNAVHGVVLETAGSSESLAKLPSKAHDLWLALEPLSDD